jgi:hypothetical protein
MQPQHRTATERKKALKPVCKRLSSKGKREEVALNTQATQSKKAAMEKAWHLYATCATLAYSRWLQEKHDL